MSRFNTWICLVLGTISLMALDIALYGHTDVRHHYSYFMGGTGALLLHWLANKWLAKEVR